MIALWSFLFAGVLFLAACQSHAPAASFNAGPIELHQINSNTSGSTVQGFRPAGLGDFKVVGSSGNSN